MVTPEEMKAIDREAPEPVEELVERAGAAVARVALEMLGGGYGRRVVVVAGRGNNGADGRAAGRRLSRRGARVEVVEAAEAPDRLRPSDLVIDAAYGTGFRGEYKAPDPSGAPVLAVDIPSGVDGLTGEAGAGAVRALRTVTFAALKPGLLLHPGAGHAGAVTVADIGLDTTGAEAGLVEQADVAAWLPERPVESHKWKSAVWVAAGSPGMMGAAHLCAMAALRAGAGTVRLGSPGVDTPNPPLEVVGRPLPAEGWDTDVLEDLRTRMKAAVMGPGLGRDQPAVDAIRRLAAAAPVPLVLDADALSALGGTTEAAEVLGGREHPTVLTPHEGEYKRMTGDPLGADRLAAARRLAAETRATVLLKGSVCVVAAPGGRALVVNTGDSRLATAGTGDVLGGVVGAFLAQGLDGLHAAAAGAWVHGQAGRLGWRRGLLAGDLLDLVPAVISGL